MGLILGTTILIAAERRKLSVTDLIRQVEERYGVIGVGISSVSAVELTHGIYRAQTASQKQQRRIFVEDTLVQVAVYPVSLEIAQLAGRIEGEQASIGNSIDLGDLLIGATALSLGYDVATLNTRHFEAIPGLRVVGL
jgi:tRNA(fMet)-specific endonuclease VapC